MMRRRTVFGWVAVDRDVMSEALRNDNAVLLIEKF